MHIPHILFHEAVPVLRLGGFCVVKCWILTKCKYPCITFSASFLFFNAFYNELWILGDELIRLLVKLLFRSFLYILSIKVAEDAFILVGLLISGCTALEDDELRRVENCGLVGIGKTICLYQTRLLSVLLVYKSIWSILFTVLVITRYQYITWINARTDEGSFLVNVFW